MTLKIDPAAVKKTPADPLVQDTDALPKFANAHRAVTAYAAITDEVPDAITSAQAYFDRADELRQQPPSVTVPASHPVLLAYAVGDASADDVVTARRAEADAEQRKKEVKREHERAVYALQMAALHALNAMSEEEALPPLRRALADAIAEAESLLPDVQDITGDAMALRHPHRDAWLRMEELYGVFRAVHTSQGQLRTYTGNVRDAVSRTKWDDRMAEYTMVRGLLIDSDVHAAWRKANSGGGDTDDGSNVAAFVALVGMQDRAQLGVYSVTDAVAGFDAEWEQYEDMIERKQIRR